MRKLILLCAVLLMVSAAYAQEQSGTATGTYMQVDSLIQKNLFKNKDLISQQAKTLTDDQIFSLQKRHTKNQTMPLFLNALLGFGSGNFYAGDKVGGSVHAVIDAGAILATAISAGIYIRRITNMTYNDNDIESVAKDTRRYMYIAIASGGIMTLNKLISLITASVYVKNYNITLTEVLGASRTAVSVNAAPVLANDRVGLAFNIKY